ncbi:glucose PTS transporter transcription antiterminator GlcT [Alteribacter natronophilus]|uniref:glucose PTS transporter transcription antiterminator GlcT n=1 Tax=Alteribacter natronophilus TaxID=2583810 RepID=UPI00110D97F0|nr:PRD domain-containing protein [Alteribacter natronophilus]TMW71635.1 PRD domain-containing protein [Alteribacter natronophilus]
MSQNYTVEKVLNNNVVVSRGASREEFILIGKGIGFGRKQGDRLHDDNFEKVFKLFSPEEQELYKQLVQDLDPVVLEVVSEAILLIRKRLDIPLNEHIHIGLTDHIAFAVKRIRQGLEIKNPFLEDTELLYPREFQIAEEVVNFLNKKLETELPSAEIGFVALHIHSALSDRPLSAVNAHAGLLRRLIEVIQDQLKITIDRQSIDYARLLSHLRRVIDRVEKGEAGETQEKLAWLLKQEYPVCYNLSWKLIRIIQHELQKSVPEAETVYITVHLQRLLTS